MPQFLYTLLTSQVFWVFSGVWFLIVLASRSKRNYFLNQLNLLILKPSVFEKDENPNDIPFYPRRLLETVAVGLRESLMNLFLSINLFLTESSSRFIKSIVDPEKPRIVFGYILSFVLLFFFVFADAVAVSNTLIALGLLDISKIWTLLTNFEIAVVAGSLFSVVAAGFVMSEIYSNKSEFSDWDSSGENWRRIAKSMAFLLIITGFIAVVLLGFQRLLTLGYFEYQKNIMQALIDLVTLVVLPVNITLAVSLIFPEGMKGMNLLFVIILVIFSMLFRAVSSLLLIIGNTLPFMIDVIYRLVLVAASIVSFILITPIDSIAASISLPLKNRSDEEESDTYKSNRP